MISLEHAKPLTVSEVFAVLHSNSPKHLTQFSPDYDGKKMFYFLNFNLKEPVFQKRRKIVSSEEKLTLTGKISILGHT